MHEVIEVRATLITQKLPVEKKRFNIVIFIQMKIGVN